MTRTDVVLCSGGLDSTVALALSVRAGTAALALSFAYGQRHVRELDAAVAVAAHYRVPHLEIDLRGWSSHLAPTALTGAVPIPAAAPDAVEQAATVVPGRNAVFLAVATSIAASRGHDVVVAGMHASDAATYADCRPGFVAPFARAMVESAGVLVLAPLLHYSKTGVGQLARELDVPIAATYSCYAGERQHCGQCGACRGRAMALGWTDPTVYGGRRYALNAVHDQ